MRAIIGITMAAACALALTACAVDDASTDRQPTGGASGAAQLAPDDIPDVVTAPPELAFATLPELTITGNQAVVATSCRVTLVFCADPRKNPHLPSYCSNGCSFPQDLLAAISICERICGNINCNQMYPLGGC